MHTGAGRVSEVFLEDGYRYARLSCPEELVPGPGQYLIAGHGSDSLLPVPIFYTDSAPRGFIGPAPDSWEPGKLLWLRGPLGHGFSLPAPARKVALISFDGTPARLRGLVQPALRQKASVVFLGETGADHLPDEVEVLSLSALFEILEWADTIAMDVGREELEDVRERLMGQNRSSALRDAQVLVHTPMPCGGVAECSVCAVTTASGWRLICREGPVFHWSEL
jgi:dihydroorotate dehydrogenase electron transfer subunit